MQQSKATERQGKEEMSVERGAHVMPILLAGLFAYGGCESGDEGADEGRRIPPPPSVCVDRSFVPMSWESLLTREDAPGRTRRAPDPFERSRGLDTRRLAEPGDRLQLGAAFPIAASVPDADGDGWADGPFNERRTLVIETVRCHDSDDFFGDDFYLVADDLRYPNGSLDDYWDDLDDDDVKTLGLVVASRTRPFGSAAPLAMVVLEGWDDDYETFNEWTVDDLVFEYELDLGSYQAGERIRLDSSHDGAYEVTLRVDVEYFADPSPLIDADDDQDGISDRREARIAAELGGIADPARQDFFVEVDWMPGHSMRTEVKRLVATPFLRHKMMLHVWRDKEIRHDDCLTVPEVRTLYAKQFSRQRYGAYRYLIMTEQIWNDASGVAWGDLVLIDDSTWWIDGRVLSQAGTLIHELGHTVGLNKDVYGGIDTVGWFSYDSAMNYTYQPFLVDYSDDGKGGRTYDHNDWEDVRADHALDFSFALIQSTATGICR